MSVYNQILIGRNLSHKNLTELINSEVQILIFLRHLGCNLSLNLISEFAKIEARHNFKLPVTYFSQGTRNYNVIFWASKYPDTSVVYDTDLKFSKMFGLKEGTVTQVLNPQAAICSLKAMVNGHFPTGSKGNMFMMPGAFIYQGGERVFSHIANSASDMPDFEDLIKNVVLKALQTG